MNIFEAMVISASVEQGEKPIKIAKKGNEKECILFDPMNLMWVWASSYVRLCNSTLGVLVSNPNKEWVVVKEPQYVWFNLYKDACGDIVNSMAFYTKEAADDSSLEGRVGCIRVELREEFDEVENHGS